MKTVLLTIATVGIAAGALAQGKVQMINNSTHLLRYSTQTSDLKSGDAALAGTPVASPVGAGSTWMMELWGNPSTASGVVLTKLTGAFNAGSPVAGRFNGQNVDLPTGYPGGAATAPMPNSFQIKFWEKTAANYANYTAAKASGLAYYASTPVFTMNPGPAAANSMVSTASPSFQLGWAGDMIAVVPEPASASLLGLGLASLLIFRRRK